MKEYHKIRWIYKFDEKTHLPISVIDGYFDNLINCNWIFTEKIGWTTISLLPRQSLEKALNQRGMIEKQ